MSTDHADPPGESTTDTRTRHAPVDSSRGDRPTDRPVVVVGGGQVGRLIARRLAADRSVHYVDDDPVAVDRAARRHDATLVADLTNRGVLGGVVAPAAHVVVATPRDATNLLVVHHVRSLADDARVTAVVADPRTAEAYPADVERVCAATLLTDAVTATLACGN